MSSDDIVYPPDVIEVLKKLRDKPEKAKQPIPDPPPLPKGEKE